MCGKKMQVRDEVKENTGGRPRKRSRRQILEGLHEYFDSLGVDDVPTKTGFAKWLGYADIYGIYELKDRKDFSPETNREGKDFYQLLTQAWDDKYDDWLVSRGVEREGEYDGKEHPISMNFTCALLNYRLGLKRVAASREVRKVDVKGDVRQDVTMRVTDEMLRIADELSDGDHEGTATVKGKQERPAEGTDTPDGGPGLDGIGDGGHA